MSAADLVLESVETAITGPIRTVSETVGADYPWKRFILWSTVTGSVLYATKPSAFFDPATGRPYEWSMLATSNPKNSTAMPWWLAALSTGFVVMLFV